MTDTPAKPNCWKCAHKREVPGNAHIACANPLAIVRGDKHGVRMGWFLWPLIFDPTWLISCDGFQAKEVRNAAV